MDNNEIDVLVNKWIVYPDRFVLKPYNLFPILLLKEPYKFIVAMIYRFYDVDNFSYFKLELAPLANQIAYFFHNPQGFTRSST